MDSLSGVTVRQKLRAALPFLLALLLWGAGFFEVLQLVRLSLFHAAAGISSDEILYFSMGRGLLNGWHAYIDLFETKPPMVFWLAALSLATTHGDVLYRVIQFAGLLAIPVAASLFALQANRAYPLLARLLTGGVAFLFGAALASFAVDRSLGFQTEGFGVVPSCFAVLLFAWKAERPTTNRFRIAAMALCLCLAVLTKEPFAVAILGGFLLLASSKRDCGDALTAVFLASVLWLLILMASGVAHGYFTVYLPEMFSGRITQNVIYHNFASSQMFVVHAPLLVRGWNIVRLIDDMWSSPYRVVPAFPFLSLSIGFLLVAHQALIGDDDRHWAWFVVATVVMVLVAVTAKIAFGVEQVIAFLHFKVPADPFFLQVCVELLLSTLTAAVLFALLLRYSIGTAQRVVVTSAALYLATLAVATGGDFSPQHFLFAVPVYVACFAALVLRGSARATQGFTLAMLGIVGCLLALNSSDIVQRYNWPEMEAARAAAYTGFAEMLPKASQLDSLLTACRYSRYFVTGDSISDLQAVTIHSPYQLSYGLLRSDSQRSLYFTNGAPNPYFHAKLVHDFNATSLLVMDQQSAADFPYPDLRQQLTAGFSRDAPACARPYLPIPGLLIFFRK
ncbi:MAG TPA: hypothetical protein VMV69_10385 [Pirellulales bacterium]|nr:hypothetical protein [Pirellulales bacterium]